MSMMRFGQLFPELAERETRTVKVFEALPETTWRHLPVDEYGFDELYCAERDCDCRRVMINVLARHMRQHVATINHAFEKPGKDDPVPEQTFLDPLNRQSSLSAALLQLFAEMLLADDAYRHRLARHYRMFKNVVNDPAHPAHRLLDLSEPGMTQRRNRSIPRPLRPAQRKRRT